MITDISLVNDTTVVITFTSGKEKEYDLPIQPSADWEWDDDDNLILTIKSYTFVPSPLSGLTLNHVAPADVDAANVALRALFPDANTGSGGSGLTVSTTTDNNYTVTAVNKFIILSEITANRSLTLPDPTSNAGGQIMVWNENSGNSGQWQWDGTVKDSSENVITEASSKGCYTLISTGVFWLIFSFI